MTRLSASQLETSRTQPQRTHLYLSIFQPRTVFQAQVNSASVARGSRVIPFDNVTLGSVADVEVGFTLLVGSAAGLQDIGKIRIKAKAASQFEVSENSNIQWANDQHLTVLRYAELWPVYPRLIQNPADEEDVIFYKDYDLAYTNQNSILGSLVSAGPHRGVFKGENVYYTSTGTSNLVGSALTYDWAFEGGSPTGSASSTPGNVVYNTSGDYVTRLIVTAANGATDTTYRYVSVHDRPGEGSDPPIQMWEVTSLGGSRDSGGFTASFRVHENVPIRENAVVVLFSDDWYGSTQTSLGGNYPNGQKIFFVGYVLDGSIHYDWQHSYVEFQVGSLTEVMKTSLGFSVSVESKAAPAKWYELLDMDCRRAIYHYLRWHTTAMQIADFQFIGNDQKIQFFDADRASMYDAIDNLMRNTLVGKVVSDRQGKVWIEQEARSYPNPTGSFSSVMEITRRDWASEPSIDEQNSDQISYLEYGGIAYSGASTGTFSAHLASAPGNAPAFRGRLEVLEGLALAGQSQLNQMVGNVWANENSPYPRISMPMAIGARNLDIAPQETAQVNIAIADTVRGVAINGLYIPIGMNWRYDPKSQLLIPTIDFKNLLNSHAGESIDIPMSVPDAGFDGGFSVPGLQIPPLPILTAPSTTVNINQTITDFQQDYGVLIGNSGGVQATSVRGVTFSPITIAVGTTDIIATVSEAGLYMIRAVFDQVWTNGTAGGYNLKTVQLGTPGSIDFSSTVQGTVATLVTTTRVHASIGGIVPLGATNQIQFLATDAGGSGGGTAGQANIAFSVTRISA